MATYFGFNPPFFGGAAGVMSRQEDERLIKNDIVQLIQTIPGERVHRPDFGTIVRSSLFEQLTGELLDSVQRDVTYKIAKFEPRVNVRSVSITADADGNTMNIKVVVSPKYDPLTQYLVELSLNGQG